MSYVYHPAYFNPCAHACRYYSEYTLETILAAAFGRVVNLQKGEVDEVTKAARGVFEGLGRRSIVRIAFLLLGKFTLLELTCIIYILLNAPNYESWVACY